MRGAPLCRTDILHGGFHPMVCNHVGELQIRVCCQHSNSICNVLRLQVLGPNPCCWSVTPKGSTTLQHRCCQTRCPTPGTCSAAHKIALSLHTSPPPPTELFPTVRPSLLNGEMGNPEGFSLPEGADMDRKTPPCLALHRSAHGTSACAGEEHCLHWGLSSPDALKKDDFIMFPKVQAGC